MIKIMFVCHGNICRSPMAEFIFKKLAKEAGAADKFFLTSSATSTEEIWNGRGNPIYPPAQKVLREHGVPFDSNKRAVQLTAADYNEYDYLIAMDSYNIKNISRIVGKDRYGKIFKLMDFTPRGGDVSDPWYSRDFETAYSDIEIGCKCLLNRLLGYSDKDDGRCN